MGEQERETESSAIEMFADLVSQLKEQAPEASGDGVCQGNAACVLQCKTVFLANALDSAHLGFFMSTQKDEEPVAFYRTKLGGGECFS